MIKGLICTDLDGTIYFHDKESGGKQIKDADLAALKRLQQAGYAIAISTGREMNGIRTFLRLAGVAFDYYIAGNGGLISNQNFKVLRQSYLNKDTLIKVVAHIRRNYPNMRMMGTDGWNVYFFETPYVNDQVGNWNIEVEIIKLADFIERDINFVMMNTNDGANQKEDLTEILSLEADLQRQFGSEMSIFRNQSFLDYAAVGISKGSAVQYLADHLNLDKHKIHVIGDSWNDASMFETGANSYSFDYADKELQAKADHVVTSFADMVDHYILKDEEIR